MLKTPLCDILQIDYPVFQGGMAWAATAELVSAVSEAGGLGIIGTGSAPADWVRNQVKAVKERTCKPFGANVMLMSPFAEKVIKVLVEEKVPVITTGAGNPGKYLSEVKEAGLKVFPVVSSVALAKRLARQGVDGFIAEGMESGGHIGEVTTMALVPQVVDAVMQPVIAAGGIADARGFIAALALGAQGVQMGTRFLCSTDCTAHRKVKVKIMASKDRDTVVTGALTGHPVRVLKNKLSKQFEDLESARASVDEIEALGLGKLRAAMVEGDVDYGSVMAGQIAGLILNEQPAVQIIQDLMKEAEVLINRLKGAFVFE